MKIDHGRSRVMRISQISSLVPALWIRYAPFSGNGPGHRNSSRSYGAVCGFSARVRSAPDQARRLI